MSTRKTPDEVRTEIAALEACKAWAPHHDAFGADNHRHIDLQIEYLRGKIDTTSDEWNDFPMDEQDAIMEAEAWEDGQSEDDSIAAGWDSFKPKTGKRKGK